MLNELLTLEISARAAGIPYLPMHPDLKSAGKTEAIVVELGVRGKVPRVRKLPDECIPWAVRDGQHNSFPLMQPGQPLLDVQSDASLRKAAMDRKNPERRRDLLRVIATTTVNNSGFRSWPGAAMLARLKERQKQLASIRDGDALIVPETIRRFLKAFDPEYGGCPVGAVTEIVESLRQVLERSTDQRVVDVAAGILIGEEKGKSQWRCKGRLLFEAAGYNVSIYDAGLLEPVSRALSTGGGGHEEARLVGSCALTGESQELLEGNFPQPNLPVVGLTWLYAKNRDIPSNDRYGRFAQQAMPVGKDVVERLSGVLSALTNPDRENKTWRRIPGEKPETTDLFLAFADTMPSTAVAGLLAADDYSEELESGAKSSADSIGAFEKQTENLVLAFEGRDSRIDVSDESRVHMVVIRKVDPANRKIVYQGSLTVHELVRACNEWAAGERNVPGWIRLPGYLAKEKQIRTMGPVHTAPVKFGSLTKAKYTRGGTDHVETCGISTRTVMEIFTSAAGHRETAGRCAPSTLRVILSERGPLVTNAIHGRRRHQDPRKFVDRIEAPKTAAALGLLLYKLGRKKEEYMNESAFRLGQLLAAADAVHAGYCADVRNGDVPPSLIGNQCLGVAQKNPVQALAALGRRWKPYDAWAKKMTHDGHEKPRVESLRHSNDRDKQQRGWDIMVALRCAREMRSVAADLSSALQGVRIDDTFRAELLLGYIAGFPKAEAVPTASDGSKATNDDGKES